MSVLSEINQPHLHFWLSTAKYRKFDVILFKTDLGFRCRFFWHCRRSRRSRYLLFCMTARQKSQRQIDKDFPPWECYLWQHIYILFNGFSQDSLILHTYCESLKSLRETSSIRQRERSSRSFIVLSTIFWIWWRIARFESRWSQVVYLRFLI